MTYQVCALVLQNGQWVQITRDATPAESAEIDARKTAPPPVPESIMASQFLRSLNYHGMRSQVDTYVAGSDQDTKDWYARAQQFERHHQKVLSAMSALSITDAQADAVWTYGASI